MAHVVVLKPRVQWVAALVQRAVAAISQGGLNFRLAQAIDFLAGRESCLLIASVSFSKSKRGLQADRQ